MNPTVRASFLRPDVNSYVSHKYSETSNFEQFLTSQRPHIFNSLWLVRDPGLHKVNQCLQECFDFVCACSKKHPSALSHATFSVRLWCFHAFLYFLNSYLSDYYNIMYYLTLQMTILAIVPGKTKMCLQENLVDCTNCGGLYCGSSIFWWLELFWWYFTNPGFIFYGVVWVQVLQVEKWSWTSSTSRQFWKEGRIRW